VQTRASAIIGRDDELRLIQSVLSAAQHGHGGAIFVVGEAGIGKSLLAATAADLGSAAGMSIMRGRGTAIGPMVPLRPLTEALMSLLRSQRAIDIEALGPYRPVLAQLVPDWGVPSLGDDGGSLVVLAEGVLRLTGLAGYQGGCLLILDDLQDSDAETLAVIEYLSDNIAAQPTVLLGTVRAGSSPALNLARAVTRRGSGALVGLQRLTERDVHEMVGTYLGSAPPEVPRQLTEYVWAASAGVPLVAVELLEEAQASGLLVREHAGWRVTGGLRHQILPTFARTTGTRLGLISPAERELLSLAAMLGQRFPFPLLQAASQLPDRELLSLLHEGVTSQFVGPDKEVPFWYSFQHSLIADVLISMLTPDHHRDLATRAARAVEATYPGLPGEWCQVAAALRLRAGDPAEAGRLFAQAGERAFHQGRVGSAVTLLDKALELLTTDRDPQSRADALATQICALMEAGQVERAMTCAGKLEQFAGLLDMMSRARAHTTLAWAAMAGGCPREGMAQVEIARRLLGPHASDRDTAPVDIVEAHLIWNSPGPFQAGEAERLARRAQAAAATAPDPVIACRAWQLLGTLTRARDPKEATTCLERAQGLAIRHHLSMEEVHARLQLSDDEALLSGSLGRLEQVREQAIQLGAVAVRHQAEASIALQAILRTEFGTAEMLLSGVLESAMRLRLLETTRYGLVLRAILAAHRARRRDMDASIRELQSWGGDHAQHAPRLHALGRAWCALLEENRPRADRELNLALAAERKRPTIPPLTGRYGLSLLLRALEGQADLGEYEAIIGTAASRLRWDRQFAVFAHAVLVGRAGRADDAARSAVAAIRLAAPYPAARHIGLRLVAEAAIADGWGTPTQWLRTAEEYFHEHEVPAVASACRALLRYTGVTVGQRRQGTAEIPAHLRAVKVTVREWETLRLLADRLGNREIAARLHLSPRTVEKHVASLLAKTGQPNRIALADFVAAVLA
jgi:DNA-binding CsgD family transcriptional regulator